MSAGIVLNKKTGDKIAKGDVLATLYTCNETTFNSAKEKYLSALKYSEKPISDEALVWGVIN
jgi:pyrimidine-nucleoside phosphorylase